MQQYISRFKNIILYLFSFISFSLMLFIVFYIKIQQDNNIELFNSLLEKKAKAYFSSILLTRQWASSHDAIYVKATTEEDLKFHSINNENIINEKEKLIKINPTMIVKELSELSIKNGNEIFFKILGSKSLKKDDFDKKSLAYLLNNKNEDFFTELSIEKKQFNLMGSLKIEKACFSCHDNSQYKIGDVLGGIRVSIPAQEYISHSQIIKDKSNKLVLIIILTTAFVSLIFMWLVNKFYKHQEVIENNLFEIKNLENSNQLLLRRYKYALDGSQYGIWDWDLLNNYVYLDSNWKRMLGYKDNELENCLNSWESRVHPDDLEKAKIDIKLNQDKQTDYYENIHRLKHKDGTWLWILSKAKTYFDSNGRALRMVGFNSDITELKKLEIKLSENKQNLLFSQKISNMGYWKWNLSTNEFFISDSLYFLLKITDFNIKTYEEYMQYILKEDFEKLIFEHKKTIENKKKSLQYYKLKANNDEVIEVEEYLDLIENEITKEVSLLGTVHSLTNRIKMEKALKEKEELMLHQSKNAAMGEMISMIAHQWRQPITAISMSANNIIANIDLEMDEKVETRSIAENIAKQTQYLSKTIDDFRNFFMQEKKTEETTFGKLFDETCTIIYASLKNSDIELRLDFDKNIMIKTYSRELLQVILNILKNAKEAFFEKDIENKQIKINIIEAKENIKLIIEDNAGGIPEDKLEKIFEAYYTTKKEQNGTGLGLYMSQTIVKKHLLGKIDVHNSNEGAVFEITLKKSI